MSRLFPDLEEMTKIRIAALCSVICKLNRDKRINTTSTNAMVEMVEEEANRMVNEIVGKRTIEERNRQTKTAATVP